MHYTQIILPLEGISGDNQSYLRIYRRGVRLVTISSNYNNKIISVITDTRTSVQEKE